MKTEWMHVLKKSYLCALKNYDYARISNQTDDD